jgi:hypothetical protein
MAAEYKKRADEVMDNIHCLLGSGNMNREQKKKKGPGGYLLSHGRTAVPSA